ncbi:MAG: hypothetical protein NWF06_08305 [Candidatus Bathyarchaeota archaeon]|nr:hypothetical protein [Candidatus Bathyarchaeum sp.]
MPKSVPCFIIMPFSQTTDEHTENYWTEHYEYFLKPIIEEIPTLNALRSEPLRGDLIREIIKDLVFSPIVVADITDLNPNVFWELGIRQSFKHGTITIAEQGTRIPFDIGSKGTLFYYPKNHIKNQIFRRKLKTAILDCMSNPKRPDSQVLEIITGRGTVFQLFQREQTIRRVDALITECENNLFLNTTIYKIIEKNLSDPKNKKWTTAKFRTLALELLITNRYLDEDESFYEIATFAFYALENKNSAIDKWFTNDEHTENWFLKPLMKEKYTEAVKNLMKKLKKIKKKLEISF